MKERPSKKTGSAKVVEYNSEVDTVFFAEDKITNLKEILMLVGSLKSVIMKRAVAGKPRSCSRLMEASEARLSVLARTSL